MKKVIILFLAMTMLSSCAFLGDVRRAEKNNRGGYLDEKADQFITVANTYEMRALRAYAMLVSLATIAEDVGLRKSARESVATQIIGASANIDIANNCAAAFIKGEVCLFFDSKMVDVSRDLYDITISILPIDELQQLFTNPRNVLTSSRTLINITDVIIPTTFRAYAIYRDVWHINYLVYAEYLADNSGSAAMNLQVKDPNASIKKADLRNASAVLNGFSEDDYLKMGIEVVEAYESSIGEFIRLVRTGHRNIIEEGMEVEKSKREKYLKLSREISPSKVFYAELKNVLKQKCTDLVGDNKAIVCDNITTKPKG